MHQELILEGPLYAVGVPEVVDRRALGLDPGAQRRDHGVAQRLALARGEALGGAQRMDAGSKQRLVGVDVADPGDLALIEQQGLDRRAAAAGQPVQVPAGEVRVERLNAEPGSQEVVQRGTPKSELAGAEATRVDEGDPMCAAVELEDDSRVRRRAARVQQQRPGHAQMDEQEHLVLELPHEVLAAPAEPLHVPAGDRVDDALGRQREAPARVSHLQGAQPAPLDVRREVAPDGLDLGQLGHDLGG